MRNIDTVYLGHKVPFAYGLDIFQDSAKRHCLDAVLAFAPEMEWQLKVCPLASLQRCQFNLTTTADKAASSSCCSPSSSSKLTWIHHMSEVLIFHLCRLPLCRLFWAHLCTEGTRVPRSLLVPKDNPSAPQIHSCRSPVEAQVTSCYIYGGHDSRKFTLPGFPPPFPLVGVGTRLFLCLVISLLFATIYWVLPNLHVFGSGFEIN